jgi:hypothetical protein
MKNFKITMLAFGLILFSTAIMAQEQGPKKMGERMAAQFEKMATDLKLTPEQKATAIQLSADRMKMQAEKMQTATTDDEKKTARKEIREDYEKKMDAAFGKELADKMRTWVKENAPQRPQQPTPPAAPAPVQ